jgi:hypothetical protein
LVPCELGLLYAYYSKTLLPDLFEFFKDNTKSTNDSMRLFTGFLKIFGGMDLEIPSQEELRLLTRDMDIYDALSSFPGNNYQRRHKYVEVAEKHGISIRDVISIEKKLTFLKRYDTIDTSMKKQEGEMEDE